MQTDVIGGLIKIGDQLGVDIHFMRFLVLAVFDSRQKTHVLDHQIEADLLILGAVIVPSFIIGLRFVTAPVYLNYTRRLNALVVPLLVPFTFVVSHWDLLFLMMLVIWMNFYVFWYHIDPPENIYQ